MLGTETSVVPFTLGSPMYGGQEATLVIFFFDETYQQKAMDFISSQGKDNNNFLFSAKLQDTAQP